ncbi:MAG: hypothetical protein CMH84_07400 [Nocardioides sp.]|nr:hypothetical protein [Nocardioides sp.]
MAKRRFVIHIGLPHAGGGSLAGALSDHAAALAEVGVRAPARSADEARRAALELRRLHSTYGFKRKEVEGTWALLCKRARKEGAKSHDAVVVSDDLLAGASLEQIALLLDSLAGFEVHVVAVLADPARQLAAAWTDAVRAGSELELRRYARRVLDPDRRLDEAATFWADQDVPAVLDRWAAELRRPDRVHVVVPGAEQDPARAGWATIARLVGADADALPVSATATAPDAASVAVLRDVNASVDGRADRRTQRQLVEAHLVRSTDAPAAVPADLHEELTELAEAWGKALAEGGYAVTGDASDLLPAAAPVAAPADPTLEERLAGTTDALADLLVELARTRERAEELEKRNAKLERKKAKLRTRLAAALAEG